MKSLSDLKREDIIESCSYSIFSKGIDIQKANNIIITKFSPELIKAQVKGLITYDVDIRLDEYGDIDGECNCPNYGDNFENCKHIAAVLTEISSNPSLYQKEKNPEIFSVLDSIFENSNNNNKTEKSFYKILFEKEGSYGFIITLKKAKIIKDGNLSTPNLLTKKNFTELNFINNENTKKFVEMLDPLRNYGFYYNNSNYRFDLTNVRDFSYMIKAMNSIYSAEPELFLNFGFLNAYATPLLKLELNDNKFLIKKYFKIEDKLHDISHLKFFAMDKKWAYIDQSNKIIKIDVNFDNNIKYFINIPLAALSKEHFVLFAQNYLPRLSKICEVEMPQNYGIKEINDVVCTPVLYLKNNSYPFSIDLKFRYNNNEISLNDENDIVYSDNSILYKIARNKEKENYYAEQLLASAYKGISEFVPKIDPLVWLTETSRDLIANGFEIYGDDKLVHFKVRKNEPTLRLNVSSNIDWFDIDADADFDGFNVSFDVIKKSIQNNEKFIKLSDGTIGIIPSKWVKKLGGVIGILDSTKQGMKASKFHMPLIESLLELTENKTTDEEFEKIRKKFSSFEEIKEVALPRNINAQLRDYQKASLHWFYFLKEFSFGGCLADDMGLGKTVQVISLLLKEKEMLEKKQNKCSIIVVPTSIVFNWQKEIEKFAPTLKSIVYHGQERSLRGIKTADILITTYGILKREINRLKEIEFHYAILDESQNIKNPLANASISSFKLKSSHRLILSGTPIENNTMELWSQFYFLNPGLLGNLHHFKSEFAKNIEVSKDKDKMESLKGMISPFILRRTKEVVAKDLPEKQEMLLYCDMEDKQAEAYNNWKDYFRLEIKNAIANEGKFKAKAKILQGLIKLRQVCNHPKLVDAKYKFSSAKFELTKNKIDEVIKVGHKVLVFSSFVKMLSLYREYLDSKKIKYAYLDGSTRNREEEVKKFQDNDNIKLFLISLKAGGLGLNLTSADYVFIIDPWWNPAAEMQAIDRAHRIGQNKKVFIMKFITKNTIEEKILKLQESKKDIVKNLIVAEESIFKELTPEMLQDLFT